MWYHLTAKKLKKIPHTVDLATISIYVRIPVKYA